MSKVFAPLEHTRGYEPVKSGSGEKLVGQAVRRTEDARLLCGMGRYVDDLEFANGLHMSVYRSDKPYAKVISIDIEKAKDLPGVFGVYIWSDIADCIKPAVATSRMADYQSTAIYPLANGVVRYVGEPIAVILAADRYIAEDALNLLEVQLDPLAIENDPVKASQPKAPLLHEDLISNILVKRSFAKGEIDQALKNAPVVVEGEFRFHRKTPMALENRVYLAEYIKSRDSLMLYSSSQVPGIIRDALAELLDLPGSRFNVISPDVGGGFGGKTSLYPEEMIVCALAYKLKRSIKWTGDRLEDLISTSQGFDERIKAKLALDSDGKITGLFAEVISDIGAYSIYPWTAGIEPVQVISFMPGPYRVPAYLGSVIAVTTPKAPTGPYRGVGRPTSTFVMERLMNMAAKKLAVDPVELRLKNMVAPEEFPYKTPSGIVWDHSAFTEGLKAASDIFSYQERREYQAQARTQGKLIGIGVASYAELSGIGSKISASPGMPINTGTDTCVLSLDSTGAITAAFGCAAHGQGHETTLAQVVADELGANIKDIHVITGDSTAVPHGTGSYASRTAVLSSGAGILAAQELKSRMASMAAYLLNTSEDDLRFRNSHIEQLSAPNKIEFVKLAKTVYSEMGRIPAEYRQELSVTKTYDPIFGTTSSATHLVEVEVDPITFKVDIKRYVIAEDCGRMINPLIVDGQIRGAVAQGIGAALLEEVVYDPEGQLLTASLVDYAIPTALEIPDIKIVHMDTTAPNTLGGFRGVGEGGTIGSPAAIANAITDALSGFACEVNELPATPERIFQLIKKH